MSSPFLSWPRSAFNKNKCLGAHNVINTHPNRIIFSYIFRKTCFHFIDRALHLVRAGAPTLYSWEETSSSIPKRSALLSLPVSLVVLVSKTCLLLFEFYPFLRHFLLKQFQTSFKGSKILNNNSENSKIRNFNEQLLLVISFKSAWAHVLLIPTTIPWYIVSIRRLLHYSQSSKTHLLCF